jgi:hypothetical protein
MPLGITAAASSHSLRQINTTSKFSGCVRSLQGADLSVPRFGKGPRERVHG